MESRKLFGDFEYDDFRITMATPKIFRRNNVGGFTLMELLVSMGISMAILGAITGTFMTQTRFYNAQEQVNEMQQNSRAAIDLMTREIKQAGYDPTDAGITGVTYSTTELRIKADIDGNGTIDDNSEENVVYTFDSTNKQIKRAFGTNAAVVLAENISGFTFNYLTAAGANATTSATVRQVSLNITARTSKPDPNLTSNSGYHTYNVSTVITPPNLAY